MSPDQPPAATPWRCHDCRAPLTAPFAFASSGIPSVHWPMCRGCFSKLSAEEQRAVEDERNKPPAF